NILDFRAYSGGLLSRLAKLPERPRLFFELKANVSRQDVSELEAGGVVWVQAGFETFSNHLLGLMKKGTTALQNIAALKWLCEFGIRISYNLLAGFPGETGEDYDELLGVLVKLRHLPPPGPEAHIVQVQRFAPFHFAAGRLGIGPLRAAQFYSRLIPAAVADPDDFAYFFDRELPGDAPVWAYLDRVNDVLRSWVASDLRLALIPADDGMKLRKTECGREAISALSHLEGAVLVLADGPRPERDVAAAVSRLGGESEFESTLAFLEEQGLILRLGGSILTLIPFARPLSTKA